MGKQRGISDQLIDNEDFKQISDDGKLLYFYARLALPEYGIGRLRNEDLLEKLGMGWGKARLAEAYTAARHYVLREGTVTWIRNALANEPSFSMGNERHVNALLNRLAQLPRLRIVRLFAAYYGLPDPWSREAYTKVEMLGMRRVVLELSSMGMDKDITMPMDKGVNAGAAKPNANGRGELTGGTRQSKKPPHTPPKYTRGKESENIFLKEEGSVNNIPRETAGTEEVEVVERRLTATTAAAALWQVMLEEGMVKSQHRLIDIRKVKLRQVFDEHLRKLTDPVTAFRGMCRAVRADPWWGAKPRTWLPETCFRNEKRREDFFLDAVSNEFYKGVAGAQGQEERGGPVARRTARQKSADSRAGRAATYGREAARQDRYSRRDAGRPAADED